MRWSQVRAIAILLCASFVLQVAHLVQFLVVFGTGIVFQITYYYVQLNLYETKSPFGLECFATLITVALGAAMSVDNSRTIYSSVNFIAIKHPILFFTIPNAICTMIFFLSFASISRMFFAVPDVGDLILYENWETAGGYLLSVSYIVYVVVTICSKDRNFIRDRISGHVACQFVAFTVAALIQSAMIFGVMKPVMELFQDYLSSLLFQPAYILGYVLLLGLVLGTVTGVLEKYAQCVVHKRRAPFYWYENSVEARTCLLQILSFSIHYGFCKPRKSLPIEATSRHFYIFTIYSALTLMQFSKILYMIIFDHKNLDVVCGYSNRTSGHERRLSRHRSRSPRRPAARPSLGQEENNQHYEGPTEQLDANNNHPRQNNRRVKQAVTSETTFENKDGFLSLLLPMELPIIFTTEVVLKLGSMFVNYADSKFTEVYPTGFVQKDQETAIPLDNLPMTPKEHLPVVYIEQKERNRNNSSADISNANEPEDISQKEKEIPKVFGDIANHVSGDNIHTMTNRTSAVKLITSAETKSF